MKNSPTSPTFLPEGERRHETTDVATRPLAVSLAMFVGQLIVILLLLAGLMRLFERRETELVTPPSPLAPEREPPPEPRLQNSETSDLRQFLEAQQQTLHQRQWVDRENGIVQIPIEEAMDVTVRRGLPSWPKVPVEDER